MTIGITFAVLIGITVIVLSIYYGCSGNFTETNSAEEIVVISGAAGRSSQPTGKPAGQPASQPADREVDEVNSVKQFENLIAGKSPTVVFFYAAWCGHCKAAKPEFDKLPTIAADFRCAKLDASKPQLAHLIQEYDIKGFPTYLLFVPGKPTPIDFNSGKSRKAQDVAAAAREALAKQA